MCVCINHVTSAPDSAVIPFPDLCPWIDTNLILVHDLLFHHSNTLYEKIFL